MAAKYFDLRPLGDLKERFRAIAMLLDLECVRGGRDGDVLHGDQDNIDQVSCHYAEWTNFAILERRNPIERTQKDEEALRRWRLLLDGHDPNESAYDPSQMMDDDDDL